MSILFDKVLSVLAFPLGMALSGLLVAVVLLAFRLRRMALAVMVIMAGMLWAASMPMTAQFLLATLERQHPAQRVETYPTADIVVVLGGGLGMPDDQNPYADFGEGSDRIIHAFRILKAGKARFVLLSGGSVFNATAERSEAHAMADLLISLGIDPSVILIEGTSRNTYENARQSAALWKEKGFQSGLLVTSASHMPRALASFRQAGLPLEPASTDVNHGGGLPPFPLWFLPEPESLDFTTKALKEWLGLIVYRWRGWA
jgi:uncharacterized SAM-binding protein YcdF (DUF218 family)